MCNTAGPSDELIMLDLPKNRIEGSNPALCIDECLRFAVFCSSGRPSFRLTFRPSNPKKFARVSEFFNKL